MTREIVHIHTNQLQVGDRILWFDTQNIENYSFEILELDPKTFSSPPGYRLVRGSLVAHVRWKNGDLDTRVWPPHERFRDFNVARAVAEPAAVDS